MKYKLIKELYDCFYTPPELSAPRQEIEECHKALIEVLEKPERRLVLQIIDPKDRIAEDTSIDSFISGFELAWQLSVELNNYIINKYFDSVDDWSVESAKAWEQYLQEMVCKVFVV